MRHGHRSKGARIRPVLLAAASTLLLLAIVVPTASAITSVKPYKFVIGPPDPVAAGTTATFSQVYLENQANTQQLGSANISAAGVTFPTPQTITLSTGSATVFSDHIELRNLAIPPGGSITFSFVATVTCTASDPITWLVQPKQSNNWSGPPGNAFNPPSLDSDFTTGVTGTCHLEFVHQPNHSVKNKDITDVVFDLTDTDAVQDGTSPTVALKDGAGNSITSFNGSISLTRTALAGSGSLALSSGPCTLSSGVVSCTAASGVATFSGLQVTSAGYYTLTATALGFSVTSDSDLSTTDIDAFAIVDDACAPSDTCLVNIPRQMQVESTNTGSGYVTLIVGVGVLDCGDDFQHAPFVTEINSTDSDASGTKTDTVTIYKQYVNSQPNNGASFFQVCYQAPHTFTTMDGTPATEGPPGTFTGLLPDCPPHPTAADAPCILKKSKNGAGDVVIVLLLPAGDPKHS